ncbi:hypothetical protein BW247_09720 [Acidihalobacter ferrooxydans]|uniref:SH3b domain-containing protein n=2 Tax=Acidihalobacter ferrooxydans TaxID=1765967 RepID=A0A1P8UHL3_9GAMM|nr:hypothetical protein BW247_09720 [Acidihalobacter ferrooxydans]
MDSSRLAGMAVLLCGVCLTGAPQAAVAAATDASAPTASAPVTHPTRYVTDQFQITLRSGPGLGHQILSMLSSGDRVTVLQQNAKNGYSEVKTSSGVSGWVLTRFLMDRPAARAQLAQAHQAVAAADAKLKTAQQTLAKTKNELTAKVQADAALRSRFDSLQQEYQTLRKTAKNAVAMADANDKLKVRVTTLERQLTSVSSENATLRNTGLLRWFMAGGGVLLVGLILGLLMPRLTRKRKDNWFN